MENVPRNPWGPMHWGETIGIREEGRDTHVALINPWGNSKSGIPSAEDAANARLIAAAPELLGACRAAFILLSNMAPENPETKAGLKAHSTRLACLNALSAAIAIAKATTPK